MSHIVYKTYFWANFGQKWALAPLQELAQHHAQYENVVFLVARHDGNKKLEDLHKNMMLGRKQQFWAKKEPLWAIGVENDPCGAKVDFVDRWHARVTGQRAKNAAASANVRQAWGRKPEYFPSESRGLQRGHGNA